MHKRRSGCAKTMTAPPEHTGPKRLRFTAEDADAAHEEWGCNCGPGALAAILDITLAEVRPLMGDFERRGYTNPTLMFDALNKSGRRWKRLGSGSAFNWPGYGLARIQWHGPWTEPGVPARVAYRNTHWVGAQAGRNSMGVFDINAVNSGGWVDVNDWAGILVPWILKNCVPKANGRWTITHAIEVDSPDTLRVSE